MVPTVRLTHIREIKERDVSRCVRLLQLRHAEAEFNEPFNYADTYDNLMAMLYTDNIHAVLYENIEGVLGVGIFLVTPSFVNRDFNKMVEIAWDAHPKLSNVRRAIIMVRLLKYVLNYYRGKINMSCFSIPKQLKGLRKYLVKQGFTEKEVYMVKEI